jgi:putative oxidoreductase
MNNVMNLAGRLLLAHIFLLAGINKIGQYAGTQGYMESMGIPGELLPLVILLEIGGALALIFGVQVRWAALGLAGFSIVSAILFHGNVADQVQQIMFMKNVALAGGLLFMAAVGAGEWSIDNRLRRATA